MNKSALSMSKEVVDMQKRVDPFTIQMFGSMEVWVDGKVLPPLHSAKGKWLLALLVLHHGNEVSREHLVDVLWPDDEREAALASLRNTLSDLRRKLGTASTRITSPTSRTLRLDLFGAEVDLITFDALKSSNDATSWSAAVNLYRGPLLLGYDTVWLTQEREHRQQVYIDLLLRLAEHLQFTETSAAIRYLRLAQVADPLRENTMRLLMKVYRDEGDVNAALQTFHDLKNQLHELNLQPDAETERLYKEIKAVARNHRHVSKGQSSTRKQQQSTCEVEVTAISPPFNVPHPLSQIFGREKDVSEVVNRLTHRRLVTLIGFGGVGKTRLAIQVAESEEGEYQDGIWFVDLISIRASGLSQYPGLLQQIVATTLGIREQPDRNIEKVLIDTLREKRLLLILDNCEHILLPCAQLVKTILQECRYIYVFLQPAEAHYGFLAKRYGLSLHCCSLSSICHFSLRRANSRPLWSIQRCVYL